MLHVSLLGMAQATDEDIWQFCKQKKLAILSKDSDFFYRALTYLPPPKVIWLNIGNASTSTIFLKLKNKRQDILDFLHNEHMEIFHEAVLIID